MELSVVTIMATVKYMGESPFEGAAGRRHHSSDYKYQTYTENVACDVSSISAPVRLAIFGLGRAGCIHLSNIVANPRVTVAYIVEADSAKGALESFRFRIFGQLMTHLSSEL